MEIASPNYDDRMGQAVMEFLSAIRSDVALANLPAKPRTARVVDIAGSIAEINDVGPKELMKVTNEMMDRLDHDLARRPRI